MNTTITALIWLTAIMAVLFTAYWTLIRWFKIVKHNKQPWHFKGLIILGILTLASLLALVIAWYA